MHAVEMNRYMEISHDTYFGQVSYFGLKCWQSIHFKGGSSVVGGRRGGEATQFVGFKRQHFDMELQNSSVRKVGGSAFISSASCSVDASATTGKSSQRTPGETPLAKNGRRWNWTSS